MTGDRRARVLVVDDEPAILQAVQTNLLGHGFDVTAVATGGAALDALARVRPDVVLLDLGLPDVDGIEVIRRVRAQGELPPVIVLSVRTAEREKVTALDLGADDYLTKPFGMDELLARVRVALRRAAPRAPETGDVVRTAGLVVDLARRRVTVDGQEVHLTPTEWGLLSALARDPDRVLTQRRLLQQVWGPEFGDEGHYLHVHMANLRRKIEPGPTSPRHIITEPGVGYRFRLTP